MRSEFSWTRFHNWTVKELPKDKGLYIFIENTGELSYIGITIDLQRRISQHLRDGKCDLTTDIVWLNNLNIDEIEYLERNLVSALRPRKNRIYTKGNIGSTFYGTRTIPFQKYRDVPGFFVGYNIDREITYLTYTFNLCSPIKLTEYFDDLRKLHSIHILPIDDDYYEVYLRVVEMYNSHLIDKNNRIA